MAPRSFPEKYQLILLKLRSLIKIWYLADINSMKFSNPEVIQIPKNSSAYQLLFSAKPN